MSTEAAKPPVLVSWFWATRPFSLTASIAPVLVGSALASTEATLDWLLFTLVLTGSVAIQVGTNLTDEYADHRRHGSEAKFLAPHKVIERGVISPAAVRAGLVVAFGFGIGAGLYIVAQAGWPILAVGLASVAVAFFYAAGPRPIGDSGISEPVVFLFMGPLMVMASYYVQVQALTLTGLLVSLPVGFLVTSIMHCNNLRDVAEDRASGKRSLATMLSAQRGYQLYAGLLIGAYVSLVGVVAAGVVGPWALLGLAPVPWAIGATRMLWRAEGRPAMNGLMVRTAGLHWWTGLTLATGLALSGAL